MAQSSFLHTVPLLRGKQGHPPDEYGSQNMAPQGGISFRQHRDRAQHGTKRGLPPYLPSKSTRVHKGLREKGRGWLLAEVSRVDQESTTKITKA